MSLVDATTLEWVDIDEELLEAGYIFSLDAEKIRSFIINMNLEYNALIVRLKKWHGVDEVVGMLNSDRSKRSFSITARISQRLLYLTEEEKEKMKLSENPLPETLELIANDIIRHEIAHIECNYRYGGDPFGWERYWFTDEQSVARITAEFIERVRSGLETPLIVIKDALDDATLPLPFPDYRKFFRADG